jgi:hypothetical protein
MSVITPEDVCALSKPTDGFLCPLSANTYGIDFLHFAISDYSSKKVIFEVGRDSPAPADISVDFSSLGEDMYRKIKYNFSEDVLKLPHIQTSLVFAVGNRELNGFRMIERHYFRDRLVKSFDFQFGFCIPGSTNTWDAVYSLPPLSDELINDMIENPYETRSDSFYFVNNRLIMHNKASYKYFREDGAQAKKSYEDKFGAKGSKAAKAAKESKTEESLTASGEVRIAEAKESSRSGATAAPAKGSKDIQWSKESDYN